MTFACPACNLVDETEQDPTTCVLRCHECKARIAYGVVMPRVVVQVCEDPRFVEVRIGDTSYQLDRNLAHLVALNIMSVCPPPTS